MEKFFRSFVFLFIIITFLNTNVFAKSSINGNVRESLATAPPTVYSPAERSAATANVYQQEKENSMQMGYNLGSNTFSPKKVKS